jgi:hypothetical protein
MPTVLKTASGLFGSSSAGNDRKTIVIVLNRPNHRKRDRHAFAAGHANHIRPGRLALHPIIAAKRNR